MEEPSYSNLLKAIRKIYKAINAKRPNQLDCIYDSEIASNIIRNKLNEDKPCMIARFGSNELNTILNFLSIKNNSKSVAKYIKGKQHDWWWNEGIIKNLNEVAGFFPTDYNSIEKFCELMLTDTSSVDILGSWLEEEKFLENRFGNIEKVHIRLLEPFWSTKPWTSALEGKKVLIIHPFVDTIEYQYKKRNLLFDNNILPNFKLSTIKSVLSLANEKTQFLNWFDALDSMKKQIDNTEFDICLIGCGAYGFPLAAYVKRKGKKAVHLGGSLQLLFGIKGKRWEDPNYGVKEWGIPQKSYTNLMNEYWVRPGETNKPLNAGVVEGACYW